MIGGVSHRIRDALIFSAHWIRGPVGSRSRVIALHDVGDPSLFREKMEWVREQFEVVSLEKLVGERAPDRRRLAITFDDGYADWYEHAAPVLMDLRLPATFFVCSGYVGLNAGAARRFRRERLRRRTDRPPLTLAQLRELADQPTFRIGSHTVNHIDLGEVEARSVLEAEIGRDRSELEAWTGRPVEAFAFPFGERSNVSSGSLQYLESAGFRHAFTIVPEFVERARSRYRIGRDSLELTASLGLWEAWLSGGYDHIYRWKAAFLGKLERTKS